MMMEAHEVDCARQQLWWLLGGCSPGEVAALRAALVEGRVAGWTYARCVIGTVAAQRVAPDASERRMRVMDVAVAIVAEALAAIGGGTTSLEEWAEPIAPGDEPDYVVNADAGPFRAALLVRWIDEWQGEREGVVA